MCAIVEVRDAAGCTVAAMSTLWGIHNDQPALDLIHGKFISIGWEELGDLRAMEHDRETLKLRLAATYPTAKQSGIKSI